MTESVPAVDRAARLLDYLAARPRESFSLSELASGVGINKGTCLSILMTLCDHGLVVRDEQRKRYQLGNRLITLGVATTERFDGFRAARTAMFSLARRLDCFALIAGRIGDSMVILDRVGTHVLPSRPELREGEATPLRPPFGTVFYAWEPEEVAKEWFTRTAPEASESEIAVYRQILASVRLRGYAVGGDVEREVNALNLLLDLRRSSTTDPNGDLRREIERWLWTNDLHRTINGDPDAAADYVIAPIFDTSRRVNMCLTLYGRPGQITLGNAPKYAAELLEATRAVTAAAGGVQPNTPYL